MHSYRAMFGGNGIGRILGVFAFLLFCVNAAAEESITINGQVVKPSWSYTPTPDFTKVEEAANRIHKMLFGDPPAYEGAEEFLRREYGEGGVRLTSIDKIAFDYIRETDEFKALSDKGYQHRRDYWQKQRQEAEAGRLKAMNLVASPIGRLQNEIRRFMQTNPNRRATRPLNDIEVEIKARTEFARQFPVPLVSVTVPPPEGSNEAPKVVWGPKPGYDPYERFPDAWNRTYGRTSLEEVPHPRSGAGIGQFESWRRAQLKRYEEETRRLYREGLRIAVEEAGEELKLQIGHWSEKNTEKLTPEMIDRLEINFVEDGHRVELEVRDPMRPHLKFEVVGKRAYSRDHDTTINWDFHLLGPWFSSRPLEKTETFYTLQYLANRGSSSLSLINQLRQAKFEKLPELLKTLDRYEREFSHPRLSDVDKLYADSDRADRFRNSMDLHWVGGKGYLEYFRERDAKARELGAAKFEFAVKPPDWDRKVAEERERYERQRDLEWSVDAPANAQGGSGLLSRSKDDPNSDRGTHSEKGKTQGPNGGKADKAGSGPGGGPGDKVLQWRLAAPASTTTDGKGSLRLGMPPGLRTFSADAQEKMGETIFLVHSAQPLEKPLFFHIPDDANDANLKPIPIDRLRTIDLSVRNVVPAEPSGEIFPLPVPLHHTVLDARVRNSTNVSLRQGYDFQVVQDPTRNTYFLKFLKPQPPGGVTFEVDLARTQAPNRLPPELLTIEPSKVHALRGSLQAAGLTQLAAALSAAADRASAAGAKLTLPHIAAIFQEQNRATELGVESTKPSGGRFGAFTEFTRNGRLCSQCLVASALFDRYVNELFADNPGVRSESVTGYQLLPGEKELRLSRGHALTRVHLSGLRFDFDTTPTVMAEDEPKREKSPPQEPPPPKLDPVLDHEDAAIWLKFIAGRLNKQINESRELILRSLIDGKYFPLGRLDEAEPLARTMRLLGALERLLATPHDTGPAIEFIRSSFPTEQWPTDPERLLVKLRELAARTITQMETTLLRRHHPNEFAKIRYSEDGMVLAALVSALEIVSRDTASLRLGALDILARDCEFSRLAPRP